MSNQPSLFSDHAAEPDQWHIFLKLADTLSTQFSIKSLLELACQVFEHDISCHATIWPARVLSPMIITDDIAEAIPVADERSPVMEAAYREKKLSPAVHSLSSEDDLPTTMAIPLQHGDSI